MSSQPDSVKTTSVTTPWAQQIPYLTQGFSQAQNLFNQPGPAYYPGQTVARQGAAKGGESEADRLNRLELARIRTRRAMQALVAAG